MGKTNRKYLKHAIRLSFTYIIVLQSKRHFIFFCLSLNFNKIYHNVRILKYIIAHLLIYTKVLFVSHIRAQAFPDYTKLLMWIYVFFFCFFFCKTLCLLKIVLSLLDTCPYKNIYYAHRYQYKNCMLRTDNSLKW